MCRLKIKTKTCEYYNNIERQADLDLGGCGATGGSVAGDIEALRKNGCVYFLRPCIFVSFHCDEYVESNIRTTAL